MAIPEYYPRPQLCRDRWQSLDGPWQFAIDARALWRAPDEVAWDQSIEVPFAPETERSGIGDNGYYTACWYRRLVARPALANGERLLLHFGAVDYSASVWIDRSLAIEHEGGYTPFSVDVTRFVQDGQAFEIVVRAEDDPADLSKPRGKQDWLLEPHGIWYPRTTGIWQTVWLEVVPATFIGELRWTPNLERWEIGVDARIAGVQQERCRLQVRLCAGRLLLASDVYTVLHGGVQRRIALSDPGIDDSRNGLLWSPSSPTLIEAELTLLDAGGQVLDVVHSYTALRSITLHRDIVLLNGRPYPLRLVLDQGYWPETGMTPPDDAALRRDVELAKAMGFNGVRKHQKLEDPRYFRWADRLGLLVWAEMPSAYRFTRDSVERLTQQWVEAVRRDYNHPCIVAWVPFNESWGVPNLPDIAAERHYVEALYHLTKTLDPHRPVIGNDGWESVATDIIGIHDYDASPKAIARRYFADEVRPRLLRRERPGGRSIVLGDHPHPDHHPIVLSEFGGIKLAAAPGTWGYSSAEDAASFAMRYGDLMRVVRSLGMLAGFCYTQFADTYQEANGLLYADRTPKFPLDEIALATRGARGPEHPLDPEVEHEAAGHVDV